MKMTLVEWRGEQASRDSEQETRGCHVEDSEHLGKGMTAEVDKGQDLPSGSGLRQRVEAVEDDSRQSSHKSENVLPDAGKLAARTE
mmetsp:Transcript_96836/g.151361  ORF Transcript_96836/g.151361 Transcript_96836/m.151361 type:complete len:86 (+) Transcript_96836:91-348(+)